MVETNTIVEQTELGKEFGGIIWGVIGAIGFLYPKPGEDYTKWLEKIVENAAESAVECVYNVD